MTRLHSYLLVALLCMPFALSDSYEPDNSAANSTWIENNGTTQSRTFDFAGDADYIKFNATAGRTYLLQTRNVTNQATTDTVVYLYFPDGTTLLAENDDDMGTSGTTNSRILFTAPQTATFFARITEFNSNAGGGYNISVTQLGVLNATLVTPTTEQNVTQNQTINITTQVTCSDGPCGAVKVTLDPQEKEGNVDPAVLKKIAENGEAAVIVTLKPKKSQKTKNAQLSALSKVPAMDNVQLYDTVPVIAGTVDEETLETLLADDAVAYVQYDQPVQATLSSSAPAIGAPAVWSLQANGTNITGTGVTVCVIDTGVTYTHADFGSCGATTNINDGSCAKVIGGYDYVNDDNNPVDDDGHGTHVAGTVASRNETYRGIAPDAKIVAIKALDNTGSGSMSDVIAGIDWCVANATRFNISVITMSLGADVHNVNCDRLAEAASINAARAAGILVTVAAGNDFAIESQLGVSTPGCVLNSTSVGATNDAGAYTSFTKRDLTLDLLAPGSSITATDYLGGHAALSGTSMATPHVAGAAALLIQYTRLLHSRNATPDSIEHMLKSYGTLSTDTAFSNLTKPLLNVSAAVSRKGDVPTTPGALPFWTADTNPVYCTLASGENCTTSWLVNASVSNGTYEFFAIYENNYSYVESPRVNITAQPYVPEPTNVTITKTSLNASIFFNQTAEFTINVSSNDTTNRTLTILDVFNASAWNYTNATSVPANTSNGSVEWTINLTGNTSWSVNVTFTPLAGGALENAVAAVLNSTNVSTASASSNVTIPDTSAPNMTLTATVLGKTSAQLNLVTNETAICAYSDVDQDYSSMSTFTTTNATTHTVTLGSLSSGTQYTYYTRCTDASNNTNNASASVVFTTQSGGGGGGGGGGGAPRSTAPSTQRSWQLTNVREGATHELNIGRDTIPVTDIVFTAAAPVAHASVTVKKQSSAPVNHDGDVYAYIAVDHPDELVAEEVSLTFSVNRSWLGDRGEEEVQLYRLEGDAWRGLDTSVRSRNSTAVTYVAVSPGLSYFAISLAEKVELPVAEEPVFVPEPVEEAIVEEPAVAAPVVPVVEEESSHLWSVLWVLLVAAFTGGFMTVYVIYTRNERIRRK